MVQVATLEGQSGTMLHKPGGKIKALARGNGLIEGYLISFGGPQDSDLEGQYFTPNTDLREKFFKDYPVLFHHGMDKSVGLDPIGRITTLTKDNVGWHVQAILDLNDRYGREVFDLVQTEPFGWSSGSVDHLVVILPSGEIVVWPLYEGSVTPSPMQPHKTTVRALKSLGISPRLRGSVSQSAYKARAALSRDAAWRSQALDQGETIMALYARPSTLKTVRSILSAGGFRATAKDIARIAAACDAQDMAQMAADDTDDGSIMADDTDFSAMGFGGADPNANQDIGGSTMDMGEPDGDEQFTMAFGDDPNADPTQMDFGDPNDPSQMAFGDDPNADPTQMDFGDDPTQMDFGDPTDPNAQMAFGDPDPTDPQQMSAFVRAFRKTFYKGNAGEIVDETPPARTNAMRSRRQKSYTSDQTSQIAALNRRIKALEFEEAPGERSVGMKGKSMRITDQADRPGAYKSAFVQYMAHGDIGMTDSMKYVLQRGARREPAADSIKAFGIDERRVKALNTSNAGSVGFAVPDDFVDELNRNIMVEAKTAAECKTRTTNSDTILIPDLTTSDARRAYSGRVTWIGETAANQAESDVTPISLGQINLPIHVMLVSTVSSLSAMEDAAFDLQAYITEAFSEMIAIEYEELIMSGNGQGKMLGLLSDTRITGAASAGVSTVSGYIASGAVATFSDADRIIDAFYHLPPQYKGRAKWFMNSNTAREIRKLKDGIGNYLWGDEHYGLNSGVPTVLLERPIVFNEFMPDIAAGAFPIVVGDLSKAYTIGKRVEFSVRRFDDSTYASQDQCLILGRARLGGQPTLPVAVKVIKIATS